MNACKTILMILYETQKLDSIPTAGAIWNKGLRSRLSRSCQSLKRMGLDSLRGIGQMVGMKTILALAVLMLGAVGCDSEKPPMFTDEELQREFDALDREAEQEELERIHQSPEYKAWLAEYEAMERRHEAENSRPIQFYSLQPAAQSEIDEQQEENDKLRRELAAENEKLRQQLAKEQAALEKERDAEYSIRGDQMRKNGIPYAVRSLSGRWVPLVGRD